MFNQNPNCGRCGHLNTRGFCNLTACLFPFPTNTVIDSYEVKPKTNADRIRAMTDEELAMWINDVTTNALSVLTLGNNKQTKTIFYWLEWLKKDATSD